MTLMKDSGEDGFTPRVITKTLSRLKMRRIVSFREGRWYCRFAVTGGAALPVAGGAREAGEKGQGPTPSPET